ncbi:MAG TPA: MarR family transcriptional regulator [Anaerolineaceae bacterium]|nr:MarR family transcriptional regulator [Anaerolineaceae bacterium]HQF61193.1 MarR family transcriptional regulator [Anaerolineaceae bacterium]HQH84334.1 MarR family transcriptional regulator [Anaerolineaceae bacterium]
MAEIRDIWLHAHHMIRSARQIINENLRSLNLSSAEGNILLHLLTQEQEMGQEQLVEQLDISKPAVSRALNSLVAKGYATWLPDPQDRRAHRVRLTEQAQKIGPDIERAYNQIYALAMRGISQKELDDFVKLFGRISENFRCAQAKKITEENYAAQRLG